MVKLRSKALLVSLLLLVCMFAMPVVGLATGQTIPGSEGGKFTEKTQSGKLTPTGESLMKDIVSSVDSKHAGGSGVCTVEEGQFTFDAVKFAALEKEAQQAYLKALAQDTRDSDVSSQDLQAVYTVLQKSGNKVAIQLIPLFFEDTSADMFSAFRIYAPFQGPISTVLGVAVIIILLLTLITTVIDLCAIQFAPFREALASKGGGNGGGSGKPFLLTHEAAWVLNQMEGQSDQYQNPFILYGKKRWVTYVAVSLCVLYLLMGSIAGIIGFFLNLFSGFAA